MSPLRGSGGVHSLLQRYHPYGVEEGPEHKSTPLPRTLVQNYRVEVEEGPEHKSIQSEYELFERFARLIERKTGVLISHRFLTVRMADRIIVLADVQFVAAS